MLQNIVGQCKLEGWQESFFVLVVSVLDMLCQPVLSPVNLFTANWYLEVLESNKELVMLHLVINAVIAGNLTELALFILKVLFWQGFQLGKYFRIFGMLGYSKNILKKNSVLIINLLIVSCKGFIPNIRIWHCMFQLSSVFKISVLDMLSQPVLGNLDILDLCRIMEFFILPTKNSSRGSSSTARRLSNSALCSS